MSGVWATGKRKRSILWSRKRRRRRWWDICDCDLGCCDLGLLSTSMLLVARLDEAGRTRRVVTSAIRGYRRVLSPRMPVRCRYEPSCSAYGLEAVERHGCGKGLRLTAARLRRCRPGVPYGTLDPVP
jgi:putative membrane protein insertion efficiency factor